MARDVANVVIATDSFLTWIGITNKMADTFTNYALTANSSSGGASVTGNSQLVGIFAANTIGVGTALRGGNVSTSSNLNITSNAIFTGATVSVTSNVSVVTTNTSVNSSITHLIGGNVSVTSNASISNANTYVDADVLSLVGGNVSISSNVAVLNANSFVNATSFSVVGGQATITSNSYLNAANVFVNSASATIQGGALSVSSNVTVTGLSNLDANVTIGGTSHTVAGNASFDSGTLFVDATNNRVGINNTAPDADLTVTGTANVSSNVTIGGILTVVTNAAFSAQTSTTGAAVFQNTVTITGGVTLSNTASITGNLTLNSDVVFEVISNTNIGNANTGGSNFTAADVYSFPMATYKVAKLTARTVPLSGASSQIQELLIAQDGTDAVLTVYGTVSAPAAANVGVFSATTNTSHVIVRFTQKSANTSVKLFAQLIK